MCVIGSLICNQNDKLYVIMTISFLQWHYVVMVASSVANVVISICMTV